MRFIYLSEPSSSSVPVTRAAAAFSSGESLLMYSLDTSSQSHQRAMLLHIDQEWGINRWPSDQLSCVHTVEQSKGLLTSTR